MYPPLALLTAAVIGEVGGVATMDLLRWLPLVVSMLCLGAFAWLAWRLLPPVAALAATFMYALMPHAYDWVIAGGGITRGVGLLFALLAMAVAADRGRASSLHVGGKRPPSRTGRPVSSPGRRVRRRRLCDRVLRARLPHLGAPGGHRGGQRSGARAAVAGCDGRRTHGADALLAAGQRLEPVTGLIRMLNLRFSGAPFMDLFAVLGVLGLVVSLFRRQVRVPLLLLATYLAGAGGGEFLAAVPWSLLGGVGGAAIIGLGADSLRDARPAVRRVVRLGVAGLLLFVALIGSIGSFADGSSKLQALNSDHLAAMDWVAANTDADDIFLIPTEDVWGDDEQSEWFPAIAGRHSLGTVQGSEWLGPDGYRRQLANHIAIRDCARAAASCYRPILDGASLFIPKGELAGPFSPEDCCAALRETLATLGYTVIYDGPGATIAEPEGGGG